MRVSRAQAEANRQRVLTVASEIFRERGFDGTSIGDVMQASGLTHGGFYGQFRSKDDLVAEAAADGFGQLLARVDAVVEGAEDPLASFVHWYLSPAHRDAVGAGCALAALAPDGARAAPEIRASFAKGAEAYLEHLTRLAPATTDAERRQWAMAALATLIGALQLSRLVMDRDLSQAILDAAAGRLLAGRAPSGPTVKSQRPTG